MYTLKMKECFRHIHMPHRHKMCLHLGRFVHSERFWPIVIVLGIITLLTAFSYLGFHSSGSGAEEIVEPFICYH